MNPNLYKKKVIQYDKFSQMFHNRITNSQNQLNNANTNEKLNLARMPESFWLKNESIIECDNPSLIFEMTNRNKFNENKKSSEEEEKRSFIDTYKENKSNFGFFKNPKKTKFGFNTEETKKFYYNKKFISKSNNNNEENDIISNFNLKHNKLYNYLLSTNSFGEIPKVKSDFNNNNNKNDNESTYTLNNNYNYINKDKTNRTSIDSYDKNKFENKSKSKEKLRLSTETERSNSKTIKNSFYYSFKGKLGKHTSQANLNINTNNVNLLNNEEISLKSNKGFFGKTLRSSNKSNSKYNNNNSNNIINNNKNEIINEELNFNNSQISMNIQDSSIIRTKPLKGESSQKLSLQLEKINLERESINNHSPRRVKDIVLNNLIEKEYAEVEKKNNSITGLIYNHNKEMTEDDFYRNFNIFNMNNLNLSHIKLKKNFFSKSPENNNQYNLNNNNNENDKFKLGKLHLFPKTQAKNNVNKDLVLDGVYNIVELKTSLKKKKNKFIITNSHFII